MKIYTTKAKVFAAHEPSTNTQAYVDHIRSQQKGNLWGIEEEKKEKSSFEPIDIAHQFESDALYHRA